MTRREIAQLGNREAIAWAVILGAEFHNTVMWDVSRDRCWVVWSEHASSGACYRKAQAARAFLECCRVRQLLI
jgi:hypothetical protein